MDTREQALIDAIVASPDDASYSVYADFLMERGGPLGELVALVRARDLGKRHQELVHELGGGLDISIDGWDVGFPSEITLSVADREAALPALATLADLPLYALARTLRLLVRAPVDVVDIAAIESKLAELARPRLLEDFVLERAYETRVARDRFVMANPPAPTWVRHRYSEALIAAFPRLGQPRQALEIPDELTRLIGNLKIDTSALPLPTVRGGRTLPMTVRELLAGLMYSDGTGAVRRIVSASCEPAAVDTFCATALDAIATVPSHWSNLVRVIGGPRTTQKLVALFDRDPEAALAALEQIETPLATLERLRLHLAGIPDCLSMPNPEHAVARAGADPQDLPADLAERFARLDREALDYLVATGYTAPLRDVIELFVESPRAERAGALVWARVRPKKRSGFRRLLAGFRNEFDLDPCFVTSEGAVDHEGRLLDVAFDDPISLAHPAELTDEQLAIWLPAARARSPQIRQLDRPLVMPRKLELWLHHNWTVDPFPTEAQLLGRGFRIEDNELTRTARYRGIEFPVVIDLPRRRVVMRTHTPPPSFIHELARELVAATGRSV